MNSAQRLMMQVVMRVMRPGRSVLVLIGPGSGGGGVEEGLLHTCPVWRGVAW